MIAHLASTPRLNAKGRPLKARSLEKIPRDLCAELNSRLHSGERLAALDLAPCVEHPDCTVFAVALDGGEAA